MSSVSVGKAREPGHPLMRDLAAADPDLRHWLEWKLTCDSLRCSAEARGYLGRNGSRIFTQCLRGRDEALAREVRDQENRGWIEIETHLTVGKKAGGKSYKEAMFEKCGASSKQLWGYVAKATAQTLVRIFLRREGLVHRRDSRGVPRAYGESLDGSDRPATAEDADCTRRAESLLRQAEKERAAEATDCFFVQDEVPFVTELVRRGATSLFEKVVRRDRILILATAAGLAPSSEPVLAALHLKHAAACEAARRLGDRLVDAMLEVPLFRDSKILDTDDRPAMRYVAWLYARGEGLSLCRKWADQPENHGELGFLLVDKREGET